MLPPAVAASTPTAKSTFQVLATRRTFSPAPAARMDGRIRPAAANPSTERPTHCG